MSDKKDVFEFLSKCWVPHIAPEHRIYYACGNTRTHDFLKDFNVSREMYILVLGVGDVRHVMKTVAGLSQRPPSSAGVVKEIHFHLNDDDQDVIARDIILLEIMNKLDPQSKSDAEFLWSVWYNVFMVKKDFARLKAILEDLIDKYSNSSRDSERICKIGDKRSLMSVLKTWNCWLKRKLNQSEVKRSRLKALEDDGKTLSFSDRSEIAKYASIQVYTDRGIKESDVETVGKEMLTAARDGFVNLSDGRKDRNVCVNPTLMRPGCEEWLVEDTACAAACYLPLQKEFIEKHSSIHEACFEKMRETISSYLESRKMMKVTYTFWATDLFHLCHWLMPSDVKFDFIFTGNLMDHVGLINLLLITQPRLKNLQSVLLTETFNWNSSKMYETVELFLNDDLMCNYMLLPSMIGLRMAEELDLGISNLQGFYRTMYGRESDGEPIYWTKSLNQENVRTELQLSPDMKKALFRLVMSTFWNNMSTAASSRVKQTPLTLMYCFQRLQHLTRRGMRPLLEYVELVINDQSMDFSRNRMTWDVVCWAFGQKHKGDQLCIVKIPFKNVYSSLTSTNKQCKLNYRLRLEYDTSSNKEEVLSLFQYDAVDQHFLVPILESAWKALPDNTTMAVFNGINDKPSNPKVSIKRQGIVIAKYNQPKRIDDATTDSSFQPIICFEDTEKYRMQDAFVEAKAHIVLLCEQTVSDSNNGMIVERTAVEESSYKFACAVDSYEIKNVDENLIQAIFYKQKTFNKGRTALPFRMIDDSELLPFTCGHDIRNYLEETMICDIMFCSPTDIESRAKAFNGQVLLTDDAFLTLRLVIEQLWHLGSKKEKTLPRMLRLETEEQRKTSPVTILDVEGYYMYGGLPLVKLRFVELDRNSADLETSKGTTKIYVKYRRCLELLKKMLFTNSLRMYQQRPAASVNTIASSSQSMNTFLQMVFINDNGKKMSSALHKYPLNTGLVKDYIAKIYSTSIRQNFVSRIIESEIRQKQLKELLSSFAAKAPQFPPGESATTKNSSSFPLKQQTSCSECKKLTTDLKKCMRCKSISYCSKECQVKDWPKHKKSCSSALLKAQDGSALKKSNESGCSIKAENSSESSTKSQIQACVTNESSIHDASSNKKLENDSLTKAKIEDCSSARTSSDGSAIIRPKSDDDSVEDSALNPQAEYCVSKSKNDDGGASTKTKDGDNSNDDVSYFKSEFEDGSQTDNSRMQANRSAKKRNEVDSSLIAQNPSKSHLQEIKVEDQNDAIADNSGECQTQELPSTVPLMSRCNSCGVLGTKMKKCSQCKSACYCSPECQRRDWNNHKPTCRRP